MTNKKEKAGGRVWWLGFGLFATFGYGIVVAVFIREYYVGFLGRVGTLELNAIGDFLAGVFAPLAFLWLFVATMMQGQELKLQRMELAENRTVMRDQVAKMEEQHALSLAVARANYKFSLFDKRSQVYQELNEVSMMVNTSGTFEQNEHARFVKAGLAAKNIFGDHKEIAEWVDRLLYLGRKIIPLHQMIERYEEYRDAGNFGQREQDKLIEYQQKLAERNIELVDAYDWDVMDRLFLPHLRLDTDIVITEKG